MNIILTEDEVFQACHESLVHKLGITPDVRCVGISWSINDDTGDVVGVDVHVCPDEYKTETRSENRINSKAVSPWKSK
jgi:hypothetical protein